MKALKINSHLNMLKAQQLKSFPLFSKVRTIDFITSILVNK